MKWYFLGMFGVMAAGVMAASYAQSQEADAKARIVIACYQAGQSDCETKWK